jgi:hypothetical protein
VYAILHVRQDALPGLAWQVLRVKGHDVDALPGCKGAKLGAIDWDDTDKVIDVREVADYEVSVRAARGVLSAFVETTVHTQASGGFCY